jgi:hypothetical protein
MSPRWVAVCRAHTRCEQARQRPTAPNTHLVRSVRRSSFSCRPPSTSLSKLNSLKRHLTGGRQTRQQTRQSTRGPCVARCRVALRTARVRAQACLAPGCDHPRPSPHTPAPLAPAQVVAHQLEVSHGLGARMCARHAPLQVPKLGLDAARPAQGHPGRLSHKGNDGSEAQGQAQRVRATARAAPRPRGRCGLCCCQQERFRPRMAASTRMR